MNNTFTIESARTVIQSALEKLISMQAKSFIDYLAAVDAFNDAAVDPLTQTLGSDLHAKVLLLKLSNIAVGKYQYLRRHSRLISRPFGLVADPCNSCHLQCPGCIHVKTEASTDIEWSPGNLTMETFTNLMDQYGPYAITTRLFNWGEPLLNRQTPQFISLARQYFNRTSISSNLSIDFDAEALVASGLDYLIMSVDGVTQKTYEKYRRKGNIDLVFENMSRLVEAKKKLGSKTPHLQWQYLLFDHTLPEMDAALETAKKIGIDEINFTNAFDVSHNDPAITLPEKPPMAVHVINPLGPGVTQSSRSAAAGLSKKIREHFNWRWTDRFVQASETVQGETCQWLYKDMVMDANGKIMPCCFRRKKGPAAYFGHMDENDVFNSRYYQAARTSIPHKNTQCITGCPVCETMDALPNVNNKQIPFYFLFIDLNKIIDRDAILELADW